MDKQQSFLCVSSSELEGVLLKNSDPFSYFMLVAFEASGLTRFILLLILWPVIYALRSLKMDDLALRLMIFVSTVGLRVKEIEAVGRAVLPKFYYDDTDVDAWRAFMMRHRHVDVHDHDHDHDHEMKKKKLVVTTKMPRIMVEWFVKEHLLAHQVVGTELKINSFGFATGFVIRDDKPPDLDGRLFGKDKINNTSGSVDSDDALKDQHDQIRYFSEQRRRLISPAPVIFHDGRLAKRPTPATALFILLWIPIGILFAIIRIIVGRLMPMCALPYLEPVFGRLHVKGKPPPPPPPSATGATGTLFVSTHRTQLDPIILSYVLRRWVPVVTYSIPRSLEVLSSTRTIRLTRTRQLDARLIKAELDKGDLMVCPEGTTCREPFLLRFSALFAELTDRIVPVAINCKVSFFYATTAGGWKGLDPLFLGMNPCPVYEVTFLDRLPAEATCSAGKSPYDVANYVQRILADTLGFQGTNLTRKDKYRLLAGNDGTVPTLLSH